MLSIPLKRGTTKNGKLIITLFTPQHGSASTVVKTSISPCVVLPSSTNWATDTVQMVTKVVSVIQDCFSFAVLLLNSLRWPIYDINSVDNTKLPCYTLPPTQHHSFFTSYLVLRHSIAVHSEAKACLFISLRNAWVIRVKYLYWVLW